MRGVVMTGLILKTGYLKRVLIAKSGKGGKSASAP